MMRSRSKLDRTNPEEETQQTGLVGIHPAKKLLFLVTATEVKGLKKGTVSFVQDFSDATSSCISL